MLKSSLFGLAIATALFCSAPAQASPGDIGGEPVKAISPISSYSTLSTRTYISPYMGPSVTIVAPGYPYNRVEVIPIQPNPQPVVVYPPIVTPPSPSLPGPIALLTSACGSANRSPSPQAPFRVAGRIVAIGSRLQVLQRNRIEPLL